MKKIISLLVTLICLPTFAEDIPGQNLLSYFSANCRTQGEWTRAALADSTSLIEALKSIQADNDCKSISGAVTQLGILNQQLTYLENTKQTQTRITQINAQEQELLIQISNNSDPIVLSDINQILRQLQMERAGLVAKEKENPNLASPDKAQAMTNIVMIANSAFQQVTSNQKCLDKNPSILNSVTSVISAVGATAAVINPAIGLGLTAGSAFLGSTIDGIRSTKNAREIRKISDTSIAYEGYKCALESMSDSWCQMRDAEAFLGFKAEQRRHPILKTDIGKALRLSDYEIPALLDWLNKIKSGGPPSSTSDANRINAVTTRENYIRNMEKYGLGLIAENRAIYDSQNGNLADQWNTIRSLITSLLFTNRGDLGFKDPLIEAAGSAGYAPFFLLGLDDSDDLRNSDQAYLTLDTWKKPPTFNPTLDLVKNRYGDLILKARTRINQQLTQVLQPDALTTLTTAYDKTGNRWKVSPMDSLKYLINFLETNPLKADDVAFKKLYANTIWKLKEIYRITEEAVIFEGLGKDSPVERIYEIAQLSYGTVVLEARLEMIIRLSLLELIENSPPEDQVIVAQFLAAERFTETITKIKGTDNLSLIKADLEGGQRITVKNLDAFLDIFGKNIGRVLSKLKSEEEKSRGTTALLARKSRTKLCFLLLAVPNAKSYINISHCLGLKIDSLIAGGPETLTITSATFNLDIKDRACTYREYFRQSKIFETWGIK